MFFIIFRTFHNIRNDSADGKQSPAYYFAAVCSIAAPAYKNFTDKIDDTDADRQKLRINKQPVQAAVACLDNNYAKELSRNEMYKRLRKRYERIAQENE